MGRGSSSIAKRNGGGGSAGGTTTPTRNRDEIVAENLDKLKALNSSKRFQEFRGEDPDDGTTIRVSVEKVTTRDYWGRSTGEKTWTVKVDAFGSGATDSMERLWYNYGVKSIKDVKDEIRRFIT